MPVELLRNDQMADADRAALAAGVASLDLMEAAGLAVADAAEVLLRRCGLHGRGATVAVACGPGNNGGDGFVAARHLRARGISVRLGLLGPSAGLKGDARAMYERYQDTVAPVDGRLFQGAAIIVDALFGAGLGRPLQGVAAEAVQEMNAARACGAAILAVDVPSGLDGSTGSATGPVVEATETVTFFRLKPGHLLLPGRRLCGRVVLAPIPIPDAVLADVAPDTFANDPELWRDRFPGPDVDAHKYTRGHVVVVSGPPDSTGAARLGARAALRAGAGLVTLIGGPGASAVNVMHSTAVMVRTVAGGEAIGVFLADTRRNAVLIGPGAGADEGVAAAVLAVLASPAAAVLDADALTAFASPRDEPKSASVGFGFVGRSPDAPRTAETLFAAIRARAMPVVLTPHEGEFKRLFADMRGSKVERARNAARSSGAIVILKGPDTVIAAPDGRAAINHNAPPFLATAGSGDVLAGFVTGLLAQNMPAFEAAAAAVWLHGACGAKFGRGLIAEDLSETLPAVLQALLDAPGSV